MIISKRYGVIYVAIPKTASQSLSHALYQQLKAGDVPYEAEALHDWHASLDEAKAATDLSLDNYFSFAFVRNPFDRFISYCAGHVDGFHTNPATAIAEALGDARSGQNRWLLPQLYFLDGVRQVYRYEQMDDAVADLSARLNMDLGDLPRLNVSERQGYAGYYDHDLKAAVAEIYADDLAHLDYGF